jgi:hypothetical protein
VAIAAGSDHSLFLKSDGSLWGMGQNSDGELGNGTLNNTNLPTQIVPRSIVAIAGGGGQSLFLKSEGGLWGMGYDASGQLGDGFSSGQWWNSSVPRPEQIAPSPQPVMTNSISSKTNLQFKATCLFGGTFYLLTSTNLTQPLNQWTPIRTNAITVRGNNNYNTTVNNAINATGQKFYILCSQ